MPGRVGQVTGNPVGYKPPRKARRKKPVKVSVPYAPTRKGKEAEQKARGHVQVPYSPTPTGKSAERKAQHRAAKKAQRQSTRKARRIEANALKSLSHANVPKPRTAKQANVIRKARSETHFEQPSETWRKANPRAAKRVDKARFKYIAEHENLGEPEDITHAIEAAGLAAGVGGAVKGAIKAGEIGGEVLLAKDAASGAASVASSAGSKVAKVAREAKGGLKARAGAKAERIRTMPERIKTAPKRAKRAATTKTGRRAATRGAARKARRHPVRTGYGAAAVSPVPLPGEADKRARAAAEGTFNAVTQHPGETLETTLRSLPAAITGPAALLGAAGSSAIHGTPKPLINTASEQAKGVAKIASDTFSGDPKKAEEAARKEGSLAFLTPLPAVTRLKPYEKARGAVREGAAKVRGKIASKGEAANRSVRHAPEGVEQNVFAATARHEARKKTALIKQRADNPQRVAAAHHERQVTKAISKAPKGSHVALQTLAEYGIRDPKHAALVREKGPGDAQLVKALDYVDTHPEVFKSKSFKEALKAVGDASRTAPAAVVGKGERARLMQQGDVFGHVRPEHMVPPKARQFTSATTREGAWADLASADKQLTQLKKRGRERLDQAKVLKGAERVQALKEGKALYKDARALRASNQKLYDALDPFTRSGAKVDTSARTPYEGRMLDEYKAKVEASRKEAGMAPAIYTHHSEANTAGRGTGMENRFPTNAGRAEHMREGNLAKADNLDRSLEGLLRGTVHMPRLRAAGKQFGRDFVQGFKTPFKIDGKEKIVGQGSKDWTAITAPRTKENPNGGQFDPKSWARFPLREWKNAIKDPFTEDSALVGLLTDAEQGKVKGSEPWILMPREAIKEARAQISPEHNPITQTANRFSRIASRSILGTNPAWAIAQIPAEGIPLLMAKPSLLNPVKFASLERDIQRYKKTNPEEAMALQATAGASPLNSAANRTPLDMQETYTPALWDKGAKALTRGKTARTMVSFAKLKALGTFDVKRQNEYRTLLAAAEADKRFRSWHGGLTGLFDSSAKLSHQFRGKSRAELWNWLTKDPKGKVELQKITDYVDAIQGNWTAFTRNERALAPLAIFYPFLRYSLRWTLWTFPKTHPITATLAYTLGQANANQLEKLVGGRLQNPIAYTYPAYQNEQNETEVLPGGSRISPGQSSLTQAVATGNPAQVLSSANPFIGAGITGLTGIEPFTGEKSSLPQGWAAVNQLLSMPAPLRLAKVKIGGQSPASKAYEALDPYKTARSIGFPFIPQTGAKFKATEDLSKAFGKKYGKGHVPSALDSPRAQEVLFGPNGKVDQKALKEYIKEIHASEVASGKVKKAEEPFYPPGPGWSQEQTEALQAIEDAWKTGPNGEPEEVTGGKYSGSSKYSSGNKYLEGNKYTEGNKYLGG
jgi:hypothetical protein